MVIVFLQAAMSHCLFFLLTTSSFIGSNAIHASTPDDVGRAVLYEHAVADIISAGMIGPGS